MPKTIYLPGGHERPDVYSNSGIDVTWTKTSGRITVGGWYDTCVGIESTSMPLAVFLMRLGITEKDVAKSFKKTRGL